MFGWFELEKILKNCWTSFFWFFSLLSTFQEVVSKNFQQIDVDDDEIFFSIFHMSRIEI